MEIYVIRHTQLQSTKGLCYGQSNIALKNTFEEEALHIAQKLMSINEKSIKNITRLYTSPAIRCMHLADFIAEFIEKTKGIYLKTTIDDRLQELNFGGWEKQTWDNIYKNDNNRYEKWVNDFVNTAPPNGETLLSMYHRVSDFIQELRHDNVVNQLANNQSILMVTHAGVIRCLWALCQQHPLNHFFDLKVHYGDIYKVTIKNTAMTFSIVA